MDAHIVEGSSVIESDLFEDLLERASGFEYFLDLDLGFACFADGTPLQMSSPSRRAILLGWLTGVKPVRVRVPGGHSRGENCRQGWVTFAPRQRVPPSGLLSPARTSLSHAPCTSGDGRQTPSR